MEVLREGTRHRHHTTRHTVSILVLMEVLREGFRTKPVFPAFRIVSILVLMEVLREGGLARGVYRIPGEFQSLF